MTDGLVLRETLLFVQAGVLDLNQYPWAVDVHVFMKGGDGGSGGRVAEMMAMAGINPDGRPGFALIGLWGYPEGSPEDQVHVASCTRPNVTGDTVDAAAGRRRVHREVGGVLPTAPTHM